MQITFVMFENCWAGSDIPGEKSNSVAIQLDVFSLPSVVLNEAAKE